VPKALSMQDVQFGVRERASPQVIDHRVTLRSTYAARLLGFPAEHGASRQIK
jgi:hypothetical protein